MLCDLFFMILSERINANLKKYILKMYNGKKDFAIELQLKNGNGGIH